MTEHIKASDKRPYRAMYADGPEIDVVGTPLGTDRAMRHTLRQIGWLGQTGAFYALDEEVRPYERGSYAPLYFIAHSDYAPEDEAQTDSATALNAAYTERTHLVALLAQLYPSGWDYADPSTPDWPVVFIDLPTGQAAWYISPEDWWICACVPRRHNAEWDGHTTEEKYRRVRELILQIEDGRQLRVPYNGGQS